MDPPLTTLTTRFRGSNTLAYQQPVASRRTTFFCREFLIGGGCLSIGVTISLWYLVSPLVSRPWVGLWVGVGPMLPTGLPIDGDGLQVAGGGVHNKILMVGNGCASSPGAPPTANIALKSTRRSWASWISSGTLTERNPNHVRRTGTALIGIIPTSDNCSAWSWWPLHRHPITTPLSGPLFQGRTPRASPRGRCGLRRSPPPPGGPRPHPWERGFRDQSETGIFSPRTKAAGWHPLIDY